jgi:type I restriction enzyme S subunit
MREQRLKEVCAIRNGYAFKSSEFKDGGTPLIRISNFDNGPVYFDDKTVYVGNENLESKSAFKVEKGDILIALSGATTGKYGLYTHDKPSLLNQRIGLLKSGVSKNLDDKYFYFYLSELQSKILRKAAGAAQPNISTKEISEFKIPLPPLDQQKKIAAILDAADVYRQKTKALIEKYDELTQSLFLDMFGDPVTNPKGWEFKTLNNVCSKITDGTHHSPTPQESGYPYVTAKHVKPFRLDFLSKPSHVSKDAHTEIYKRCTPELGDILYIKDGATTGIACVNTFDEPISLLSSLALLKPGNEVNNQYLCYWLNHKGIKQKLISEFMSGAAIKRFTLKKINSFKLMIPNIELQNQFAERVQAIEEQKAQAQAGLAGAEDLFNSLLQRAFKGELTA